MEAQCSLSRLRSSNCPRITMWDAEKIARLNPQEKEEIKNIINNMGVLSAAAQKLRVSITNYELIRAGLHRIYLSTMNNPAGKDTVVVKGILKVGLKNLFIRKENGTMVEIAPLCVLDFYVHSSCQRVGLGRQLFEAMLTNEKKCARQLGYDKPSSKLISFLSRHYHLKKYFPQANQFVVFDSYFEDKVSLDKAKVKGNSSDFPEKANLSNDSAGSIANNKAGCADKMVLHGRRANNLPEGISCEANFSGGENHLPTNMSSFHTPAECDHQQRMDATNQWHKDFSKGGGGRLINQGETQIGYSADTIKRVGDLTIKESDRIVGKTIQPDDQYCYAEKLHKNASLGNYIGGANAQRKQHYNSLRPHYVSQLAGCGAAAALGFRPSYM